MKIAMPKFGSRVSPSLLHANSMLIAEITTGEIVKQRTLMTRDFTENEWIKQLEDLDIDILVCGGIVTNLREDIESTGIKVIHNVAAETQEVLQQLSLGDLQSGYGISYYPKATTSNVTRVKRQQDADITGELTVDCIGCVDKVCLKGRQCPKYIEGLTLEASDYTIKQSLETTVDINLEPERILCRVAELVYYCLGMQYSHIGLAFCKDLFAETETLTHLLRRFFKITPICCKVGGIPNECSELMGESTNGVCNPMGMAAIFNLLKTDVNIILGLCIGCDIIFTKHSVAPVTTLFVKDKFLANNPIAAMYSKYQLERLFKI